MSQQGKVAFFNAQRNFGFITPDDGEEDVFVHGTAVTGNPLQADDVVKFDITESDDGRTRAANVTGGTGQQRSFYGGRGGYGRDDNSGDSRGRQGGQGGYNNGGQSYGGRGRQTRGICYQFRDYKQCRFGEDCRFSHEIDSEQQQQY